jgi:putative ABC transport system substrate-binding protein
MKKNIFYFALGAVFFGLSVRVDAQQPAGKVPRIGFLANSAASIPVTGLRLDAFRQGLHELGYVEGKNLVIEYRYAEGQSERLPKLAEELVRLKVDILVVDNTNVARAARKATVSTPIVLRAAETLWEAGWWLVSPDQAERSRDFTNIPRSYSESDLNC